MVETKLDKLKNRFLEGEVLLIDKPLHWTSFQVVNKLRWIIRKNLNIKKIKVGHAGTLDPLATGLLLICTGRMTKQIPSLQGQEKEYTGSLTLGATTPSYDLETEIDATFPFEHITPEQVKTSTSFFKGEIKQRPPIFSALKSKGKRLYEYAREGVEVEIPERTVLINEFSITELNLPTVDFKVRCSKGTYIRSLAHDFGKKLDSGAYLNKLRRTAIGNYRVENAIDVESFEKMILINSSND